MADRTDEVAQVFAEIVCFVLVPLSVGPLNNFNSLPVHRRRTRSRTCYASSTVHGSSSQPAVGSANGEKLHNDHSTHTSDIDIARTSFFRARRRRTSSYPVSGPKSGINGGGYLLRGPGSDSDPPFPPNAAAAPWSVSHLNPRGPPPPQNNRLLLAYILRRSCFSQLTHFD